MNSSPVVYCPFCGRPLKILDMIPTVSEEGIANVSICDCGVIDVIVRSNKVVAIRLRRPESHPDFVVWK